jgi:protein O-mannosyl-transferase
MATKQSSRGWEWVISPLLVLGTFLVYGQVVTFQFLTFDDSGYVTANPHVFRGITAANVCWALTSFDASNWHPVTWLSHMLDCQLFGHQAGLHHLTSLLFHATNALLLFWLFRFLTHAPWRSGLVAALFAWHPLHVESVAWIAERKDVLSAFFGLLALHAYARWVKLGNAGSVSSRYYVVCLLCYCLGLMSKPMLVTLPFVFLLLDYWPLGRLRVVGGRNLVIEKLPFLALSAVACVVTVIAQHRGEAIVEVQRLGLGPRMANALVAYAGYLRKMVWPSDLAVFYPYRHNLASLEILGAFTFLVVISVLAVVLVRRAPYFGVGWGWYLGMLVPVIGLVQVGGQSMADRYTYLPLIGIFIMIVWSSADALARMRHGAFVASAASVAVLAGCLGTTWSQEQYWHDTEALFRRDLQLYPTGNATAPHCLGRAFHLRGDDLAAIEQYEQVLRLLPKLASAHVNLANSLTRLGRFPEAQTHYDEAIRLRPENPEAYKCLGSCLAAEMKLDAARTNFLTALQYKPDYAEAHMRLGTLLMAQGKVEEGMQHLATAVRIHPDYDEAQYYLANALAEQKKFAEAARHFRAAIRANPDYAAAMNDLVWMLVTKRGEVSADRGDLIRLATRACELTGFTNIAYLETLGVVWSEAKRFPEAISVTEKACALAAAAGNRETAELLQKRVLLYRSGRSYSEAVRPSVHSSP